MYVVHRVFFEGLCGRKRERGAVVEPHGLPNHIHARGIAKGKCILVRAGARFARSECRVLPSVCGQYLWCQKGAFP